ncbi:SMI1/KNR4 family protein [Streptomyces hydrogenans]|uniref:SMI1/KNR4 family protein n=1 Tax=Streptomyces hydrogenans TaxID=1873719 RepID=UPI00381D5A50
MQREQSAMSVAESWSRVMALLRQHAPADHADLPGPATEQEIAAAEVRMGIPLPGDLRTWLLQNSLDLPEEDVDDDVACCGFDGFPDEGSFFLGIRAMERLYANRSMPGGFDPPDRPDNPFWRNEWIPFLSDQDGWTGKFIDARDGRVGRWFVGDLTVTGEYESMGQYFDSVAEMLTRIAAGTSPVSTFREGRIVWS